MKQISWPLQPKKIHCIIHFTELCNFNCPYCITKENRLKNKKKYLEPLKIKYFLNKKFIPAFYEKFGKDIFDPNKFYFLFAISGGEFSVLNINIIKNLIKNLKFPETLNNYTINFLTNFSNSNDYYIKILQYLKEFKINYNLQITYHSSEWKNFQIFYQKLNDFLELIEKKDNLDILIFKKDLNNLNKIFKNKLKKIQEYLITEDIDYQDYKILLNENKNLLRPVLCENFYYTLNTDETLELPCQNISINFLNFSTKYINKFYCNHCCSDYVLEKDMFKKLKE